MHSFWPDNFTLQQTGCTLKLVILFFYSVHKMPNMVGLHHLHGSLKLLMLVVTMLTVITTQPTLVKAVDILGFDDPDACSGFGLIFPDIGPKMCAAMDAGSILITDLPECTSGWVFTDGGCSSPVFTGNDSTLCFTGGSFTGAAWFIDGRRQGAKSSGEPYDRCTDSAVPNGVHYTEHLAKGSWVLETANGADVLAELRGVDDVEKVAWLVAHGAYHVSQWK